MPTFIGKKKPKKPNQTNLSKQNKETTNKNL